MNIICTDFEKGVNQPCKHISNGCCLLPVRYRCIEYIRRKNPEVSQSSLNAYIKCRRFFYYYYILGLQLKKKNSNMLAGELLHAHLAIIHNIEKDNIEHIKTIRKIMDVILPDIAEEDSIHQDIKSMNALVEYYKTSSMSELKGLTEHSDVLFYDDMIIKAIYDLMIIPPDNNKKAKKKIYDWKFTAKPDNYTFFTTKNQAGLYLLMSGAESITYRTFNKPNLRQGAKESEINFQNRIKADIRKRPSHYFGDTTYYSSEYNFKEILAWIKTITDEIKNNIDKGIDFFYENHNACFAPYKCDYMPICEGCIENPFSLDIYKKREVVIKDEVGNE